MRYFGFLLKNNLLIIVLSCLSTFALLGILESEIHDIQLDKLFLMLNLIWLWMFVSHTYWVDLSNNMIAKLLVNGGNRKSIWMAKPVASMLNAILLVMIEVVLILYVRGFDFISRNMVIHTLLLSFLMVFWMVGIISLGSVLFKSPIIIIIASFIYITPYTYYVLDYIFGNTDYNLISINPFYEMLRMYNQNDIKAESVCFVLVLGSLLWIISFVIYNKKEYRNNI